MSLPLLIEKKEKAENKEKMSDFLTNGKFAKYLIVHHGEYLKSITPPKYLNEKKMYSFMLKQFQNKYNYLKNTEGWRDNMIKTIIWNVCVNWEKFPMKNETYLKYENLYYSSVLEPYPKGAD